MRAAAEQLLPHRLAVRAEEKDDEPDEQQRVEQRQREHERRRQPAVRQPQLHPERGQDGDDDDLGGEAGTEDDFERGRRPLNRRNRRRRTRRGDRRRQFEFSWASLQFETGNHEPGLEPSTATTASPNR